MAKEYISPELELKRFRINDSVFTSEPGPPDLNSGEDLDPDGGNSGSVDANGYFAEN